MDQYHPLLINATHDNIIYLNQINGNIHISRKYYKATINNNDSFYQCYKYDPYFLFRNLRIRDIKYETYFPAILKNSCEYKSIFKKEKIEERE